MHLLLEFKRSDIEVVATFTETRPGNVAIFPDGRIFISMQPLDNPMYRVIELALLKNEWVRVYLSTLFFPC